MSSYQNKELVKLQNSDPEFLNTAVGGAERCNVPLNEIDIPDLWHILEFLKQEGNSAWSEMVSDAWLLAHDLRAKLYAIKEGIDK